jgi:hypothetical protein
MSGGVSHRVAVPGNVAAKRAGSYFFRLGVLAVFVGIEDTGVLLGYALLKQNLGLFRWPTPG